VDGSGQNFFVKVPRGKASPRSFLVTIASRVWRLLSKNAVNRGFFQCKLEGKYSLESTDPRESEIRATPQPLPYLMPIPANTLFYNK